MQIIIGILDSPLTFIFSFFFTLSFVLLYLDDFKLSNNLLIKYVQIFSFIIIPIYLVYNTYIIYSIIDVVDFVKDNNNNVDYHGHISLDKEAGKAIGQGLNTIGSNVGLGASVAGLGAAVAKGIAKGSLPPFQKAGVIIAGGVIGGIIHTAASAINHNSNIFSDSISSSSVSKSINNVNNLIDLGNNNTSPIETLLHCLSILSSISLFLLIILSLQLFYKFFVSDKPKLKWIGSIFTSNYSETIKLYIYKIIKLNKNMSMVYIVIIIILLIISMFALSYISLELVNNLDKYVNVYIEQLKK